MECHHHHQNIVLDLPDPETEEHLKVCEQCAGLAGQVNAAMLSLDEPVEIPESLYSRIMSSREFRAVKTKRKRDISLVFQFSTVLAAAILLGIILGFHANRDLLLSKNQKKSEALMEFREFHHLNVDRQPLF